MPQQTDTIYKELNIVMCCFIITNVQEGTKFVRILLMIKSWDLLGRLVVLWWWVQWSVEADGAFTNFCCQHGAQKSLCSIRCDCFTSHKLLRECGHMHPRLTQNQKQSWSLDLKCVLKASSSCSPPLPSTCDRIHTGRMLMPNVYRAWDAFNAPSSWISVIWRCKALTLSTGALVLTFTHLSSILAAWMCTNRYKTVGTGYVCATTCPIAVPEVLSTSWDHPFHLQSPHLF